jgi:hypothetical protein
VARYSQVDRDRDQLDPQLPPELPQRVEQRDAVLTPETATATLEPRSNIPYRSTVRSTLRSKKRTKSSLHSWRFAYSSLA